MNSKQLETIIKRQLNEKSFLSKLLHSNKSVLLKILEELIGLYEEKKEINANLYDVESITSKELENLVTKSNISNNSDIEKELKEMERTAAAEMEEEYHPFQLKLGNSSKSRKQSRKKAKKEEYDNLEAELEAMMENNSAAGGSRKFNKKTKYSSKSKTKLKSKTQKKHY